MGGKRMESNDISPTPRIERKVVEKNRRIHMKSLYSKLSSLLPNQESTSKENTVPLPDQIDEAVTYIKSLQMKIEQCKQKKDNLLRRKRSRTHITDESDPSLKSPQIEIHEAGSALNITLVTREDEKFLFHEILRIIQEEGADVVNASFSVRGHSVLYIIHAKCGEFVSNVVTSRLSNSLKKFVYGSTSDKEWATEGKWNFEIQPDIWKFEIP